MTIDIKLNQPFTDSSLPIMPHGTGITFASGETPYRWLAEDLSGTSGTAVSAWSETNGVGTLLGGGATLQTVEGYKSVAFGGTNGLSIPSGSLLPSSRSSMWGVARLAPEALETTRYGLLGLSTTVGTANGVISKETNSKMRFTRIGTAPVSMSSVASISPGQYFTFGFRQGTANAIAMLNGVTFSLGAGDIAGFNRFFLGTISSSVHWLGNVFEIGASNELLTATQFTDFHAAMADHYSFIQ